MVHPTRLSDLTAASEAMSTAREFSKLIFARGLAATNNVPLDVACRWLSGGDRLAQKAAVAAGSTSNLGGLADPANRAWRDLMIRGTVLSALTGTVPAPPGAMIPLPLTDPDPQWIGEGLPIPLGRMTFDGPSTSITKYGILQAFTNELFRVADERAIALIERATLRGLRRAEDRLLLSADAAVPGVSPAGLLFGVTVIGGGSPESIDDLEELWTSVRDGDPDAPYFIASRRGAMYLATLSNSGVPQFPDVNVMTGGSIAGVPLVLSKAAGANLILIDASLLAVSDLGIDMDRSEHASIEMLDNPTNSAITGTGTALVSAFQANAVVLRFIRWLNWKLLAADAVGFVELPIYGSPA
jgi:HK97 family phage major capsid protein